MQSDFQWGRRSRRNSSESSSTMGGRTWKKKQLRATSLKPFKLRTELLTLFGDLTAGKGRQKEEEFMKKIQEMMIEEERQRIPIAQGLPWTTDEPECLMKPPVKDITIPTDLKLYSDMRAVERAEFDHQVAEKMNLFEQYKMERERLQKLAEEEEIRRLRKELVPKAQPMPYFDRPFIPRSNYVLLDCGMLMILLNFLNMQKKRVQIILEFHPYKVNEASHYTQRTKVSCASAKEDQVLLAMERYRLLHLPRVKLEEDKKEPDFVSP
ncbi:Targeting protein for Xklp2 protein family [Prunus dulcis]|uniref:Targeting protein for Xklp2 protein family n=1 Tax=Prunus dulcis TaxID=3755 RepID=A0A4Y1R803_PRUDU|nr:Targeting protein for Xklp2 protein family [Prunus dulcis]